MRKQLDQLPIRLLNGDYDELLEKLFELSLSASIPIMLATFLIMFQLGYFEYRCPALKPIPGFELPLFPN